MGYYGLGEHSDFFYDGGKDVRPNPNNYDKYWNGMQFTSLNIAMTKIFMLLQEVDNPQDEAITRSI